MLRAEAMDDPDALWVHELIGCRVRTVDGTERGVVEVVANPAATSWFSTAERSCR